MPDAPAKPEYTLVATQTPGASPFIDKSSFSDPYVGGNDEDDDVGHAYAHDDAPPVKSRDTNPWSWLTPKLVFAILVFVLFLATAGAAGHPTSRGKVVDTYHRVFGQRLPAVERNPNVTLSEYLHARFDSSRDVIMWTMATSSSNIDYVPQARNWDAKRRELGMNDTVVVLCLDDECMENSERGGLRAWGGYAHVEVPPPSNARAKRGAERGHHMAYIKFLAMLEMAQTGFPSLFFEGDTFLTDDPFKHMLKLEDPSWDVQFTEDVGYLLNFGWIYARPSEATIKFYQAAFDQYVAHNQWDQELLSNMVVHLGGVDNHTESGEHWWIADQIGLRMYMLPLDVFRSTHPVMLNWYTAPETEAVMNHLTAVTYSNRQFYPKEQGWQANIDDFYTRMRPILTIPNLNGTLPEIMHEVRIMHALASATGRAYMIPEKVSAYGTENGQPWHYTRDYTRIVSVEAAVKHKLDLLETRFFEHAVRYLPADVAAEWSANRSQLSLADFSSLSDVFEHVKSLPKEAGVIELVGWEELKVAAWSLDTVEGVEADYKTVSACENFHIDHMPFTWCTPLHVP
ncbi:hypothetical protein Rhopal_004966-T1 [Rhodotorula paludigena]|uniref:Nucleotide-diphospho-sugar transferase domain-containing protein n=1 Tax=Rhodotorula paludigena TaxID=86838 RepID=A0AAV5GH73_9BASI|nr:hypothetical protein Rhopal_004966-T1 [Rhodotorula paludigena]